MIRSMTRPMTTFLLRVGLLDLVPDLHLLGFFAREDDVAFPVFGALEQHVDGVAGLDRHLPGFVDELVDRNDAFGLVADVDDDLGRGDFQDGALDDLTFRDVAEAGIVKVEEAGVFLRIDIIHLGKTRCLQISGSGATSFGIVERRIFSCHAKQSPPRSYCRDLSSGGLLDGFAFWIAISTRIYIT